SYSQNKQPPPNARLPGFQQGSGRKTSEDQERKQISRSRAHSAFPLRVSHIEHQVDERQSGAHHTDGSIMTPQPPHAKDRQQQNRHEREDRFSRREQKASETNVKGRVK